MNWYLGVLRKYAVFDGRAGRKEFWMFMLVHALIGLALKNVPFWVYSVAVLLPTLAVGARRLHDTGRVGWWLLIPCIPLIGPIVLFLMLVEDSHAGTNQYGPNPNGRPYTSSSLMASHFTFSGSR